MRMRRLTLPYRICDVFTATALAGNQLAVFEDAGQLSDVEMQSLARELNLSETTFIIRRDAAMERDCGLRVRIFTTREELPFAGHPTLGTASMARLFLPEYGSASELALDLNVGKVAVRFRQPATDEDAIYGEMTQPAPWFGSFHDREAVASALGLTPDELAELPIQTVSTGLAYCIVPLKSVQALEKLQIRQSSAEQYLAQRDAKFFYCIADEGGHRWRARMQFYGGEDQRQALQPVAPSRIWSNTESSRPMLKSIFGRAWRSIAPAVFSCAPG